MAGGPEGVVNATQKLALEFFEAVATTDDAWLILDWSENGHRGAALWWKTAAKGYTTDLLQAGIYTRQGAHCASDRIKEGLACLVHASKAYGLAFLIADAGDAKRAGGAS